MFSERERERKSEISQKYRRNDGVVKKTVKSDFFEIIHLDNESSLAATRMF